MQLSYKQLKLEYIHTYIHTYNSHKLELYKQTNMNFGYHHQRMNGQRYWRLMNRGTNTNYNHRAFVSSTTPKSAGAATATATANHIHHNNTRENSSRFMKADYIPIYMMGGFIMGAGFLAVRSATQELVHNPGVQVIKSNRNMFPEIDNPDAALACGDNFVTKSVLRKVAHIQQHSYATPMDGTTPPPDIYTRSRDMESLKTVGVTPRSSSSSSA